MNMGSGTPYAAGVLAGKVKASGNKKLRKTYWYQRYFDTIIVDTEKYPKALATPRLYYLVGPPLSGKSELASKVAEANDAIHIDFNFYRNEWEKKSLNQADSVPMSIALVARLLHIGFNVVADVSVVNPLKRGLMIGTITSVCGNQIEVSYLQNRTTWQQIQQYALDTVPHDGYHSIVKNRREVIVAASKRLRAESHLGDETATTLFNLTQVLNRPVFFCFIF